MVRVYGFRGLDAGSDEIFDLQERSSYFQVCLQDLGEEVRRKDQEVSNFLF